MQVNIWYFFVSKAWIVDKYYKSFIDSYRHLNTKLCYKYSSYYSEIICHFVLTFQLFEIIIKKKFLLLKLHSEL